MVKTIEAIVAKGKKIAAHLLEVSEEDIEWELGRFYVRSNKERGVTIQECAMAAYSNVPDGMEPGLENNAYYDPPNLTWPFACYIATVEVDPETGVWDVLKFVAVSVPLETLPDKYAATFTLLYTVLTKGVPLAK
mgnify:CR=1 FL=1